MMAELGISPEWAKQLVYMTLHPDKKVGTAQVMKVPDHRPSIVVPILKDTWPTFETVFDPTRPLDMENDWIDLVKVFDLANMEFTMIGYGEKSNVIAVGRTWPIEPGQLGQVFSQYDGFNFRP